MITFKVLETDAADFKDLCSLGGQYQGEVGTAGVREAALKGLAGALKQAFQAARNYQRGNLASASTDLKGVKNLTAFHDSQMTAVKSAGQSRLNTDVINFRTWLSRQGAWFTGDDDINWPQTLRLRVIYDMDPALQSSTKVTVAGGILYTADGKPFDTASMVTHFSGPGAAVYVMSAEGNLHVHSHSVGHYHHSSLLAGGQVAGAGELRVRGGRITWLSNKSGHYHPGRKQLMQVLAMLQKKKVNLDFALTVMPENKRFNSVNDFMVDQQLDDAHFLNMAAAASNVVNAYELSPVTGAGGMVYEKSPVTGAMVYQRSPYTPTNYNNADYTEYLKAIVYIY